MRTDENKKPGRVAGRKVKSPGEDQFFELLGQRIRAFRNS